MTDYDKKVKELTDMLDKITDVKLSEYGVLMKKQNHDQEDSVLVFDEKVLVDILLGTPDPKKGD